MWQQNTYSYTIIHAQSYIEDDRDDDDDDDDDDSDQNTDSNIYNHNVVVAMWHIQNNNVWMTFRNFHKFCMCARNIWRPKTGYASKELKYVRGLGWKRGKNVQVGRVEENLVPVVDDVCIYFLFCYNISILYMHMHNFYRYTVCI